MLPKSRRIQRQRFPTDPRVGFVVHGQHTTLRYVPQKDEKARFSAVISKKVAISAVKRHLWKRRVYEAVRVFEKRHPTLPSGSYVFFAKRGATDVSFKKLSEEVSELVTKWIAKQTRP